MNDKCPECNLPLKEHSIRHDIIEGDKYVFRVIKCAQCGYVGEEAYLFHGRKQVSLEEV